MYVDFLREIEEMEPSIKPLQLSDTMADMAKLWSKLAAQLKEISGRSEPEDWKDAAEIARRLYDLEKNYYDKVLSHIEV